MPFYNYTLPIERLCYKDIMILGIDIYTRADLKI